jgi:hypothetical protein
MNGPTSARVGPFLSVACIGIEKVLEAITFEVAIPRSKLYHRNNEAQVILKWASRKQFRLTSSDD